jgi:hypothetical protein
VHQRRARGRRVTGSTAWRSAAPGARWTAPGRLAARISGERVHDSVDVTTEHLRSMGLSAARRAILGDPIGAIESAAEAEDADIIIVATSAGSVTFCFTRCRGQPTAGWTVPRLVVNWEDWDGTQRQRWLVTGFVAAIGGYAASDLVGPMSARNRDNVQHKDPLAEKS